MNKQTRKGVLRHNEVHYKKRTFGKPPLSDTVEYVGRAPEVIRVTKTVRHRCCLVHPKQSDFGNLTQSPTLLSPITLSAHNEADFDNSFKQYSTIIAHHYGLLRDEAVPLSKETVESFSQYDANTASKYVDTNDGHWQPVDDIRDVEQIIRHDDASDGIDGIKHKPSIKNVHISHVPKIKVIAEKFSKFKRNFVELRRLEEKVVCVEYDVYDQDADTVVKPVQKMRAYFSIKPNYKDVLGREPNLPSKIKRSFKVTDDDLKKLTEKEIEIIDSSIGNNSSYLKDLHRMLKRVKYVNQKRQENFLNLRSLYEMAKLEKFNLEGDLLFADILSKDALDEIKELILERPRSSVHGINRRKMPNPDAPLEYGLLSGSIVAELLREDVGSCVSN